MSGSTARGMRACVTALTVFVCVLLGFALSAPTSVAQADVCTPSTDRAVVDSITLDKHTDLRAWENVRVTMTGRLTSPGCAGDSLTVIGPDNVWITDGTYDVSNADQVTIGVLRITDGTSTVTFNDHYETAADPTFSFWITAAPNGTFDPETTLAILSPP